MFEVLKKVGIEMSHFETKLLELVGFNSITVFKQLGRPNLQQLHDEIEQRLHQLKAFEQEYKDFEEASPQLMRMGKVPLSLKMKCLALFNFIEGLEGKTILEISTFFSALKPSIPIVDTSIA